LQILNLLVILFILARKLRPKNIFYILIFKKKILSFNFNCFKKTWRKKKKRKVRGRGHVNKKLQGVLVIVPFCRCVIGSLRELGGVVEAYLILPLT